MQNRGDVQTNLIGLLVFLFLGFLVYGYQYEKIEACHTDLAAIKAQITSLQSQTSIANEKVQLAHDKADTAILQANQNSKDIMNQKISHNCDLAIAYAIKQAKVINK